MIKEQALQILQEHSPYGVPLENHCIRLAEFTLGLAKLRGIDANPDLVYAGAYLHDIGLLVPNDDSKNYLYRGAAFVTPYLEEWGLGQKEKRQMNDMLLYNHSFRTVSGISPLGKAMRCAVQVEHSFGKWSHGLDRGVRKEIFKQFPRNGLNSVLFDFFKISLKRDGTTELLRLFFPI